MASINRQTRSDFQFCMRNANNSQSLGVHTHFCGRCNVLHCRAGHTTELVKFPSHPPSAAHYMSNTIEQNIKLLVL